MTLLTRFITTWDELGLRGQYRPVWELLTNLYNQPHRAYHNLGHIRDTMKAVDEFPIESPSTNDARGLTYYERACVQMGLYFHDVIYDPRATDNEERSADLFTAIISQCQPQDLTLSLIRSFIIATKSHMPTGPHVRACAVMLDCDLASLGDEPDRFDERDAAIRQEYSFVPEGAFREGRYRILSDFARRARLFHSDVMHEKYDANARANLARAMARYAP